MNALGAITIDSCPKCGHENFHTMVFSDTVDFRNMELDVENLQESKCAACGYKWESKPQRNHNEAAVRAAYAVMRDKIRNEQGLLTGDEIAAIREKFALTQREAATLFGGGYNAFNKYESGEVLQSQAMDRLLRLANAVGRPAVDFLKDVFSQPNFKVISSTAGAVYIYPGACVASTRAEAIINKVQESSQMLGTASTFRDYLPDYYEKSRKTLSTEIGTKHFFAPLH